MKTITRVAASALILFGGLAGIASASHAWSTYHWARTANPFTVKLGDNVNAVWDPYLVQAAADWSVSNVPDATVVAGSGKSPLSCRAVSGRGLVCNAKYGYNGWLGIAQIYISGTHITAGTVKLSDTYFNTSTYNKPEWRALVVCQEIGHIFGLGHQDENMTNANLDTCMDYTNSPASNQHPNAHDYEMLETIYGHTDTSTTLSQSSLTNKQDAGDDTRDFGRELHRSEGGRASHFEYDLGNGNKIITEVFWADEIADGRNR